jgi:hypothetical protein
MYFNSFPTLIYTLDNNETAQVVTDILRRVALSDRTKSATTAFYEYAIRDGETPEILAHKIYGDTNLHWIILHVNEIVDPREEWPMDNDRFLEFLNDKYGVGNLNNEHHREVTINGETIVTDDPIYDYVPEIVSNYDYEYNLNESKRQIKILKPRYVAEIITEMQRLIKE